MKHPKLTPLRAFELLRKLDEESHYLAVGHGPIKYANDLTRDALASHVRAAIARAGSR